MGEPRIAIGRGDAAGALAELAVVERAALDGPLRRAAGRRCARARTFAPARTPRPRASRRPCVEASPADAFAAEALSVRGVALAFTGDDTAARETLDDAIRVARALAEPRIEAVALGSVGHRPPARGANRETHAQPTRPRLAAAEKARDAGTVAAMRLNLAGLAQVEGDLAQALGHLEAAVDMGRRAGSGAAVTQAS